MSLFKDIKRTFSRKNSNPLSSQSNKSSVSSSGYRQGGNFLTSLSPTNRHSERSMKGGSSSEDPPPYTAAPNPSSVLAPQAQNQPEDDPYDFLRTFDTVFLIDDSGSMSGANWDETRDALQTITPICTSYDTNGIDVHFLNHPRSFDNITSVGVVTEIFQSVAPRGGTPTGQRLYSILAPYLARYCARPADTKPMNLIVITDGVPTDDPEAVIAQIAVELDAIKAPCWQIGIQFFQVGKDYAAREHLKNMDDNLRDSRGVRVRDIVDTVPFKGQGGSKLSADGVLKTVLGAVNRRLDRKSDELHNHGEQRY